MNKKTEVMKMAEKNKTPEVEVQNEADMIEQYKKQIQAYENTLHNMDNKIGKLVDLCNTLFQKYLGE